MSPLGSCAEATGTIVAEQATPQHTLFARADAGHERGQGQAASGFVSFFKIFNFPATH